MCEGAGYGFRRPPDRAADLSAAEPRVGFA
ncbi:hypothetical protein DC1_00012 [Burkholderia phage DC1]|uniref:Uncharacterized protein n=1 Tax=Burkholderia phage DC1 TaxID=2881398 RepID=I6NV28_9CAUD|nr:hypothetical protein B862_gp71 [Burkholderia phage DC1]AEZ50831.1 hypothetical protein DC1_00012 [Burkholderia phage DC1]